MELNDVQKQAVKTWAAEGCTLSEIQQRLREQFQLSLTYMDVRLLVIELGLQLKERPTRTAPALATPSASEPAFESEGEEPADRGEERWAGKDQTKNKAGGQVQVGIDRVTKAGTLVSGTVRFSDGVTGSWSLDQFGRLLLQASRPGYHPSAADMAAFQRELRDALERRGY